MKAERDRTAAGPAQSEGGGTVAAVAPGTR